MPLINCPKCGNEISDKASTCPNCGSPLKEKAAHTHTSTQPPKAKEGCFMRIMNGGCMFVIGFIAVVFLIIFLRAIL